MKKTAAPIRWEEGKMYLEFGKTYIMTGKEIVDFGFRVCSDGYLIATGIEYLVQLGIPTWIIHQKNNIITETK